MGANEISALIRALDAASDRYGFPHVLGFLARYGLAGFCEATEAQLREYVRTEGLG